MKIGSNRDVLQCFLITRAIARHGSMDMLRRKHQERREQMEADESYRRGTILDILLPGR